VKKRVCIYAKDIQNVTGRSERYAYQVIAEIRRIKNKDKNHLVTVREFSEFVGIDQEDIYKLIE
jgi:hypothetical protein